jgi:hypothetical protein
MPRRYRDWAARDEESAWDRYFEQLEDQRERQAAEEAATEAAAEPAAVQPTAWQDPEQGQVDYLRKSLAVIEMTADTESKINHVENLMLYLLAHCSFLYRHHKFRLAVKAKVIELRQDARCERIFDTLDKVVKVLQAIQELPA